MNSVERSSTDPWSFPAEKPGATSSRGNNAQFGSTGGILSPPPAISLPKGGGVIKGIGEKFSANSVTGTVSLSVPIHISLGRSGFGPQLSLSYDSGAGNSKVAGNSHCGLSLVLPSKLVLVADNLEVGGQ